MNKDGRLHSQLLITPACHSALPRLLQGAGEPLLDSPASGTLCSVDPVILISDAASHHSDPSAALRALSAVAIPPTPLAEALRLLTYHLSAPEGLLSGRATNTTEILGLEP